MRFLQHLLYGTYLLLGVLPLSAANVPLTLTASIDHDVLLTTPRQIRRGLPNTPRLSFKAAKVTLTFTNTGDEPLKLNTYDLQCSRLQLSITAPDEGSISLDHDLPVKDMPPPRSADFPILQPGTTWTMARPISFPDDVIGNACYVLQHTGVYHLRFIYAFMQNRARLGDDIVSSDGAFQGAVASNTVSFKLITASEPVNGLQIGLDVGQSTDPSSGEMTFTAYLRNVSDKPITVNAWNLSNDGLQLEGDNGKLLPDIGARYRSAMLTLAERYCTLAPGEQHAFPQRAVYHPALDTLTQQMGNISAVDNTGMFRNWTVPGSIVNASALLASPVVPEADAPTPLWSGKVISPAIVIPLNPTAYRQAKLKQENVHFALQLNYAGTQDKPYLSLHFGEKESASLIDFLAHSGALRDATAPGRITTPPERPIGYTMVFSGSPDNAPEVTYWSLELGWKLDMYRRLQALQAQLLKDKKEDIGFLLMRLDGPRAIWESEDALRQPVVTLDTTAGTLNDVAHAIVASLNTPAVQLTIDPAVGARPTAAYHFFNVTAIEALQSLATMANVNFTANGPNVALSSLKIIVD